MTDAAIRVTNLSKCYHLYGTPRDRLKQFVSQGLGYMSGKLKKRYFREFWALRDVSFEVVPGEVVGIVGRNGSGKSTLLQLICGTLMPTSGGVVVNGRVAALLELGAGFNPEFTGRENVLISAAIMGMSQEEIAASFEAIVEFSGIRDFIDQPVKTYSSGMYVRLAFSVAIASHPDILIIDEALSVGDGEFSRKSFDRIMELKNAGKTILFCSHSLYQVEALCNQALWVHKGRVEMQGESAKVVNAYRLHLDSEYKPEHISQKKINLQNSRGDKPGVARITNVEIDIDGKVGQQLRAVSGKSDLAITVSFNSDLRLPPPVVAVGVENVAGQIITSAFTSLDGFSVERDQNGRGRITLRFCQLPLLKGNYWVGVVLMCENNIYFYDTASRVAEIVVDQANLSQGIVSLPHDWTQDNKVF